MADFIVLIKIHDERTTRDTYKQIISKFYATVRHLMYHKVQDYWRVNGSKAAIRKATYSSGEKPTALIEDHTIL